jgi:hypothetical protein
MDLIDPLRGPRLLWQVSLAVVVVLLIVRFALRKRRRGVEDSVNDAPAESGENESRDD